MLKLVPEHPSGDRHWKPQYGIPRRHESIPTRATDLGPKIQGRVSQGNGTISQPSVHDFKNGTLSRLLCRLSLAVGQVRTTKAHHQLYHGARKGGHSQGSVAFTGFGALLEYVAKLDKGIQYTHDGQKEGQSIAQSMNDKPNTGAGLVTKQYTGQDGNGYQNTPRHNHETAVQYHGVNAHSVKSHIGTRHQRNVLTPFLGGARFAVQSQFRHPQQLRCGRGVVNVSQHGGPKPVALIHVVAGARTAIANGSGQVNHLLIARIVQGKDASVNATLAGIGGIQEYLIAIVAARAHIDL
mmetsp:Transcript_3720/g.8022  ORF Transcript_3720/g.8022 Transcript_3720/m.8022 type:complete len:296 (-) Transcript_3720:636-1523(-)